MTDILKGGRFNPSWITEAAIIEAFQENREFTMLGTTQAAFAKLSWRVKQLGWLILKEIGVK